MRDTNRIFISHTAQDERDFSLAHRLAKSLRARGADVWIAPDNIPAGSDWKKEIVKNIMEKCTDFLIILSAASSQATGVLNEIALAKERFLKDDQFRIFPLMVGKLGDFAGRKFLDQFQRITYYDEFSAQVNHIAQAMGLPPNIPDQFKSFIESRTKDFIGREYVFSAFDKFTEKENNGYFIVQGDPGEGKSAILAEYVKRTGCISHFNIRSDGITRANQFLENICSQLIARFGLSQSLMRIDEEAKGGCLIRVLEETSLCLREEDRLIIAIDALDEVDQTYQTAGSNVLYLPQVLPKNIYFFMTRRRMAAADIPFYVQSPQEIFDLGDHKNQCTKDIQTYIEEVLNRPKLQEWILSHKLKRDEIIYVLSEKSERNFMYLHYIFPEIENGAYRDLDIAKLPVGLIGYYEDHWDRMGMKNKPLPYDKIKIIYILSEVRQPVSRSLISDFIGQKNVTSEEIDIQMVLDEWRQFLQIQQVGNQLRYSLYHTSFRDFLHRKDIVKAAGITIKNVNRIIADNLLGDLFQDSEP